MAVTKGGETRHRRFLLSGRRHPVLVGHSGELPNWQ